MAELWINEFEEFPVFGVSHEKNPYSGSKRVPDDALSDDEIRDFQRVTAEAEAWNERLKALYHKHY